jgi:hypothetical protein
MAVPHAIRLVRHLRRPPAQDNTACSLFDRVTLHLYRTAGWSHWILLTRCCMDYLQRIRESPGTHPVRFTALILLASWLPLSFGPALWPDDESAQGFMSALWQVEAAAFGLVVAALLFLFEAYAGTIRGRYGISLQRYARGAGVTSLIGLFTASLLLTGATLLGLGDGAPRGWAGAVTLGLAVYSLLRVPLAFREMAGLITTEGVDRLRREHLEHQVSLSLRENLYQFEMQSRLLSTVTGTNSQLSAFTPRSGAHPRYVAASSGVIKDIDMCSLERIVKEETTGGAHITLVISMMGRIRTDTPVLFSSSPGGMRPADFLTIDTGLGDHRPSSARYEYLQELQEEALGLVRARDHLKYQRLLSLYEFIVRNVLEFDKTLLDWGFEAIGKRSNLIDEILADLHRQFSMALAESDREVVRTIGRLPSSLVTTALREGQYMMAQKFVGLLTAFAVAESGRP